MPDLSAPLDCYADGSVLGCYASETHLEGELDENPVLRTVSVQRNMDIIRGLGGTDGTVHFGRTGRSG